MARLLQKFIFETLKKNHPVFFLEQKMGYHTSIYIYVCVHVLGTISSSISESNFAQSVEQSGRVWRTGEKKKKRKRNLMS